MDKIKSIRDSISKAEIKQAFLSIKELIQELPLDSQASEVLETILLLEYQYNDIHNNIEKTTKERFTITKNRIIYSLLKEVTEIEIKFSKIPSNVRSFRKYQWATELNLANTYESLLRYKSKSIEAPLNEKPVYEKYLAEKIQKLEKLHRKMMKVNSFIGISIALYFVVKTIKLIKDWDIKMNEEPEINNYPHQLIQDDAVEVNNILLIEHPNLYDGENRESSGMGTYPNDDEETHGFQQGNNFDSDGV